MAQEIAHNALLRMARRHSLTPLAERLAALPPFFTDDLVQLEAELQQVMGERPGPGVAAARYLLEAGGKRVRPLMCLLAARMFQPEGRVKHLQSLAGVAELIHSATLLHDDVIDLGDFRRGRPAARKVFGNAVAVLGGDLLLVESVTQVDEARIPGLLMSLLEVLAEMITAETLQLDRRGRIDIAEDDYFEVVRGKTGALFRWSVEAGGAAAGAPRDFVEILATFGYEVGISFQLVDDLLDLSGDPTATGKAALQDINAGTITFPVILALRANPALGPRLLAADPGVGLALTDTIHACGALEAARREIELHTERARSALTTFPDGWARDTLAAFVTELAERAR